MKKLTFLILALFAVGVSTAFAQDVRDGEFHNTARHGRASLNHLENQVLKSSGKLHLLAWRIAQILGLPLRLDLKRKYVAV